MLLGRDLQCIIALISSNTNPTLRTHEGADVDQMQRPLRTLRFTYIQYSYMINKVVLSIRSRTQRVSDTGFCDEAVNDYDNMEMIPCI